jgi:MarR family transcriptional regulator, organic hydroperoxide resistance regulator
MVGDKMSHLGRAEEIAETVQCLRRIVKAIEDYSHEVSSSFGITGPQLWALKTISQSSSLTLGNLSKQMYLHPSTISGVIDRLEGRGLVQRVRDTNDRRVVTVELTPAGQELVKRAPNPVQGKMIYGLTKLKRDELRAIYDSVRKLTEIVEAEHVKATFFFDKD